MSSVPITSFEDNPLLQIEVPLASQALPNPLVFLCRGKRSTVYSVILKLLEHVSFWFCEFYENPPPGQAGGKARARLQDQPRVASPPLDCGHSPMMPPAWRGPGTFKGEPCPPLAEICRHFRCHVWAQLLLPSWNLKPSAVSSSHTAELSPAAPGLSHQLDTLLPALGASPSNHKGTVSLGKPWCPGVFCTQRRSGGPTSRSGHTVR